MIAKMMLTLMAMAAHYSSGELLNGGFEQPRLSGDDKQRNFLRQFAFRRDVVRRAEKRSALFQQVSSHSSDFLKSVDGQLDPSLASLLMEKAVPLDEYNADLVAAGGEPIDENAPHTPSIPSLTHEHNRGSSTHAQEQSIRHLEDGGDNQDDDARDDDAQQNDDYYMDPNNMNDLSGYSLKYATCQKVQRFSSEAIANGEYSALITDDIVILRLCPQSRCDDDLQYGCYSGYGEYAIDVSDYLRIMIMYEVDKQKNLCGFCKACAYGYSDGYWGYSKYNERSLQNGDDYFANDGDDNYGDDQAADDDTNNDDTNNDDNSGEDCDAYADICENYGNWCIFDGENDSDEGDDDNQLPNYMDYVDYFDCVQIEGDDNYDYWISPRCESYSTSIRMGIYYDQYCSQYAGNDVQISNVADFDFTFQNDIFEDFYSGACISCDASYYPPFYSANHNMCNKLYQKSGKCNTYLALDLEQYQNDDDGSGSYSSDAEAICGFVESIRDGTYDTLGQVSIGDYFSLSQEAIITSTQKIFLIASSIMCVVLAVYSCYLHHEITNLLLKSLASGHLMPGATRRVQSKHIYGADDGSKSKRRRGRSRSSSRKRRPGDGDWDHSDGEYA